MTLDSAVMHPAHYMIGNHEVLDVIEDCLGCDHRAFAIKYIARAGRKGEALQDLLKAREYMRRMAGLSEGEAPPELLKRHDAVSDWFPDTRSLLVHMLLSGIHPPSLIVALLDKLIDAVVVGKVKL